MPYTYSVFDLIGPIMVGPSSSHTAGAARLARLAHNIFNRTPTHCRILLYGSFAETYLGHGTHFAIAAGLMGWLPDDERIPKSLETARELGLEYQFVPVHHGNEGRHPNTVAFEMSDDASGETMHILGHSPGGGVVVITEINGFELRFEGKQHTILVLHLDRPGVITRVTRALADDDINVSAMYVSREARGATSLMVIETDQPLGERARREITALKNVEQVSYVEPVGGAN